MIILQIIIGTIMLIALEITGFIIEKLIGSE